MNELPSRKDCSIEKPFPGCLGGMVSLFDLTAVGSGRRLLTDKPHFNGDSLVELPPNFLRGLTFLRTCQYDEMMSETPDETEIEDKMIISESRRSLLKRNPNCTPMKMLIAQEMPKETGGKDGPPNVVAKLMGLDVQPSRRHSPNPLRCKLKGYARHYENSVLTWTEEQTYLERQMRNKDCRLQKKNDYKDVYEVQRLSRGPNSIKGISTARGRNDETIRDDKMAFVRQKFLEEKRLATNEKLLKSKEFQDAVDVLRANSDAFLKLLQEPNTRLSKNLNELQPLRASPAPKCITVLRPSNSIKGISTPRGRNDETVRDDKMAFVRQKFLEAKCLATNEKLLKSKEFQDAVAVLRANSDVFLKLFQEPNTRLSKKLNELRPLCASPAPKCITVLRPSKMVANNRFCSAIARNEEPVDEPKALTQDAPCARSILANFSPTYAHQNRDRYVSQPPTRIVVLKPSFQQSDDSIPVTSPPVVSSSKLIQGDFIHVDGDTDARTSREIAREVTHYTRETILHQRMGESLLSSAVPNGHVINYGSPFKKLDEIQAENLSDPKVTSPASRHSWEMMNNFDSLSTSSLSHTSYSPNSSVCREAKKRLSERWAVMASNGKCREERHLRKSSSTLGEMLALPDSKISNEKQGHYECKVDEPRMSASCLKASLSGGEFMESPTSLSRSKSVPLYSTLLSGDRMDLRSISPDSCQRDGKEFARDKGATSFKGIVSNVFSARNKRKTRENSCTFRFANESQMLAKDSAESSAYIVNRVLQSSSSYGKNRQEDNSSSHFQNGAPGKTCPIPVDLSLNGSTIAERPGPCVSRSPLVGSGANQDQLNPVSVLDRICEDDNSTTAEPSGKELTSSSLRCNLIDKSPRIGSISRTLSGDYSRKSEPPYAPNPSLIYSCAKEEEQELPAYIRRLLSTIGICTEDDINSTDISRWHSPDSPLDPTILNKCPGDEEEEDNRSLHEARKRLRRTKRKLVFDCVNATLLMNAGFGPVGLFKVEDRRIEGGPLFLGDRIWGQIKDWFLSEASSVDGYDEDVDIMTVERVVCDEVVRKGWVEGLRMEVERVGREIGMVMLQELVYEALVDLTGKRGNRGSSN